MATQGSDFYDDDEVFKTYMMHRQRPENPNDTLEKPVLMELLGNLTEKRILDLGCGDGNFGLEALKGGCAAYTGVEGSSNMVEVALKNLAGTTGQIIHANLESWIFPEADFDLVVSRLVLHYIELLDSLLSNVYRSLAPLGRFVFSVEHPVITSCDRAWLGQGQRQEWLVDDYFATGPRITNWLGGQVIKYHRTLENYYGSLQRAGFVVESVRESCPQRANFLDEETYRRRMRIPLFLLLAGKKL